MSTITANNVMKVDGSPVLGWTLLSTTVASGDATIDITGLTSDYFAYKFIWYAIQPATDDRDIWMRTSSDNGISWDSAGSDYAWAVHEVSMATSPIHIVGGDSADSEISVIDSCGSATNETNDYEITLFNPSGTEYTKFKWEGFTVISVAAAAEHVTGAGVRLEAAAVNGVRFLFETGNIAQGTLKVYGVRA